MTTTTMRFRPERFRRIIRAVAVAASTDEARPLLCGIHFTITGGRAVFAATDSYMLHRCTASFDSESVDPDATLDVVIPARWLTDWRKRYGKDELAVVEFCDGRITISDPDGERRSVRLISTEKMPYPDAAKFANDPAVNVDGVTSVDPRKLAKLFAAAAAFSLDRPLRVVRLDPLAPCKFTAANDGDELTMILMPVRVP